MGADPGRDPAGSAGSCPGVSKPRTLPAPLVLRLGAGVAPGSGASGHRPSHPGRKGLSLPLSVLRPVLEPLRTHRFLKEYQEWTPVSLVFSCRASKAN